MVKRSGGVEFAVGSEMPLPQASRSISIFLQYFRKKCGGAWDVRIVAGIITRKITDRAHAYLVMIASRQQRCPCRRAHCRHMETRVPQPGPGQAVQRGRRDRAAERCCRAISCVIQQYQQNVGGSRGRTQRNSGVRCRLRSQLFDVPPKRRLRGRKNGPVSLLCATTEAVQTANASEVNPEHLIVRLTEKQFNIPVSRCGFQVLLLDMPRIGG